MGHTIAVSRKPADDAQGRTRTAGRRLDTCRYLTGRGQFAHRCTAEPVTHPDLDSLELCGKHLGLAVAAYSRIAALTPLRELTDPLADILDTARALTAKMDAALPAKADRE